MRKFNLPLSEFDTLASLTTSSLLEDFSSSEINNGYQILLTLNTFRAYKRTEIFNM